MNRFRETIVLFLVTGAGVGYVPWLPGTVGTMTAVPLSLGLNRIGESNSLLATVLLIGSIAAAVWLCTQLVSMLKQKDPQFIVIDEIVGFLLANFLAPFSFAALLWSFALFRFFDISKIFPADRLEQLPGGAGIVLDDVMAGVYTFVSLRLLLKVGWV